MRTGIIGESKDYLDWRVAHFLGDRAAMTRARRALDTLPYRSLLHIIGMAQVDGVGMADAAHAVELLRTRGGRRLDDWHTQTALAQWTINRGAPAEATRLLLASSPVQTGALRDLILFGMYAGGDSSAAARAAGELAARTHAGHPLAVDQANNLCVLTQWRLWRSEPVDAQAVVTSLRAMQRTEMSNCATLIAAIDGVRNRRRNGRGLLEALDREQIAGERPANDAYYGNIAAARLWEQSGDLPRALAAARRRPHNHWEGPWFLRSFLETEVRLAKQNGDRTGAARAASHLERLASRSTP